MTKNHAGRFAGIRKRMLIAGVAVIAPLAMASPAMAEHHPKGNYAPFKYCPLSNKLTELCTVANTNAGEFTVGKKTVPITKTITLQGGLHENEKTGELEFIAAEGAETLSKTKRPSPEGCLGSKPPHGGPRSCRNSSTNTSSTKELTGVTEITELAKPASAIKLNTTNLIFEEGVALQLPVKVKLNNTFLGSECYVGSSSKPITLNLTTGTTSPPAPEQTNQRQRRRAENPRSRRAGASHRRRPSGQRLRG